MRVNDNHNNNARGKDPVFGAIFIANSESRRECFKKGLFGLPSSYIPFVEKIKPDMALFLFDYEKKLLHGVFKATSKGGSNIDPKAFTSLGIQYPAQVKFTEIWKCKPLPEKIFRDAIRENYFAANKFNFGLSGDQVNKLLHLFDMNKLEPEVPRRRMSRADDMTSEQYSVGEVGRSFGHGMLDEGVPLEPYSVGEAGRSFGHGMLDENVQNDRVLGDKSSPVLMHNYQGDYSARYNGFSADDILVSKQRRSSELGVDYTSGYVGDYLPLKDESRLAAHNNADYLDNYAAKLSLDTANGYVGDYLARKDDSRFTSLENNDYMLRPYSVGGYVDIPSDDVRVHGDGRSSISDRLMGEDLRKSGQRMIFSDDTPSLHDSNVDLPVFYNRPNLEQSSLVENHRRSTSAMIHPFHLSTSCATQGAESSILYDPDAPGLNFRQLPSFGINNGSESITERLSPSTNCGRNSTSREPQLVHTELKDKYRWHNIGDCFPNSVLYGSNRECIQNSGQLASESALYEARSNIFSLKSLSAPIPSSDIGNSGRTHEPFSSLFDNYKSYLDYNVHPMALQEYPSHDITLAMNNGTLSSDVPLANWDHFQVQYDDSLDHGYDMGCHGDSQNSNHGHPNKKSSVFSRISYARDVNKQENRNNAQKEEYGSITSVDEVMEMVRRSQSHRLTKRKPTPNQRNNTESLRNKTQLSSQSKKNDCFENALEHNKDESLRNKTQVTSQRKKRDLFENALEHNEDESLRSKTQISSLKKEKRDCSENALEHNEDESLRNKGRIISLKTKKRDCSENGLEHNEDESLRYKTQTCSMKKKKRDCFENALDDLNTDSTTVTGGNPNTTTKVVDFKRRSKVRKHSDEIERSSNESKKSENLVVGQQKRRKLIRPNFNKSASYEDKDINLGGSQNLQLSLPNGSRNHKDVIGSGCTLVNQCDYDVKTDAEIQNINYQTQSEVKNSSHATEFIFSGGEKANVGALPTLFDGSECADNKNHQKVLFSASCSDESFHNKEGSCMMDNVEAASLEKESLRAICQEKANVGTLPELNDGSECVDNKPHQKFLSSASCNEESSHTKGSSCMVDNVKAASLKTESLHALCQEKANAGTFPALNDGSECVDSKNDQKALPSTSWNEESSHTKEGSRMMVNVKEASLKTESLHAVSQEKANVGTLHALNDGSECADNKNHQKVLSSASCNEDGSHTKDGSCMIQQPSLIPLSGVGKEGSCMMDNIKSASLETESLNAICQEHNVDKIICADRCINANDKMPKDCGSFSVEAKDGSEYLGSSGSENAPIETSCHIEACM
ncbi:DCD (development and cell death) domain protein [Medicago truncatula]|uniref:DCD (Development and cell death) domain protein n=1 Tax=Medicago truncatula TaxID=3880 RepID=G7JIU5_MEDTR|nr:DCD (development and cell death) domain protein [Medicago truncatula]